MQSMRVATKTVKVTADDHRKLKVMAAMAGEQIHQTVARLIKEARKHPNGVKGDKK